MNARFAKMAWRNLWRQPRRTVITLSSIAFGTFFAILATSMQDGNWRDMIDTAARLGGGHVALQHEEYLDTPTLSRTVDADTLAELGRDHALVRRDVSRISGELMIATSNRTYGAAFIAYDPANEDSDSLSILEDLVEGTIFGDSQHQGIVLGSRLAKNLGAHIGTKVVFTLTDKEGEIVRDVARVSGIFETGVPTMDRSMTLLPIDRVRQLLGYAPGESIRVALFLDDQRGAASVAEDLSTAVQAPAAAIPWYETAAELSAFITMKIAGAYFLQAVIMLLVAAGIFNTLFVSVMERVREFGIMLALGFSSGTLFRVVMYESAWLAVLGLGMGGVITYPVYRYLAGGIDLASAVTGSDERMEVAGFGIPETMAAYIYPENLVIIIVGVFAATLLSGVYPAWKAGRVEPVESIRLV